MHYEKKNVVPETTAELSEAAVAVTPHILAEITNIIHYTSKIERDLDSTFNTYEI